MMIGTQDPVVVPEELEKMTVDAQAVFQLVRWEKAFVTTAQSQQNATGEKEIRRDEHSDRGQQSGERQACQRHQYRRPCRLAV